VEILDLHPDVVARGVAVLLAVLPLGLVAADAEGPVAGPGEDDDAASPVPPGGLEGVDEFVDGVGAEGVELVRPVDGGRR
jgi:hypothetical protein